jgi:hypothetical protein
MSDERALQPCQGDYKNAKTRTWRQGIHAEIYEWIRDWLFGENPDPFDDDLPCTLGPLCQESPG